MTTAQEKLLIDRLRWLRDKLNRERKASDPESLKDYLLIGRTEGNIGAIEWCLRELKKVKE